MRCGLKSIHLLLLAATAALVNTSASSATCPYDIASASRLIPRVCYANYTASSADSAPPNNCCSYVFVSFIFAAIRYANESGAAFLPSPTAAACSDAFASYLIRQRLVRPSLLRTGDRCNLNADPDQFAAGKRACQYPTVSAIRSAVDIFSAIRLCAGSPRDLLSDQPSCKACQNTVINATILLLGATSSKEFVPCGMATTIGIWSTRPDIGRFRSYALCMLQVLDDVGSLGTSDLIPSPPFPSPKQNLSPPRVRSSIQQRVKIVAIASSSALVLSVLIALALFVAIRRWKERMKIGSGPISVGDRTGGIDSPLPTDGLYIFTKGELKHATNGFDPTLLLGEGGAGKVYLGKLPSGQHVAIKRISHKKKIDEFYMEVEILAKLRHRNLTTLLGYCLQKRREHLLVYEYMPGGNLARALHHGDLTWHSRVGIAADVAEGLAYLHEFPDGVIIHRDVKPTNILLTESGLAKLSDFGVSKILPSDLSHVSTAVIKGTRGYVDPECYFAGQVSEATDVYSFGIVLLELVTGRRAVVPTASGGAESIVYSAYELMAGSEGNEPDVLRIADRKLGPGVEVGQLADVFKVAYRCVRPYKNERPRMKEVVEVLRKVLKEIEMVELGEGPFLGSDDAGDPPVSDDVSGATMSGVSSLYPSSDSIEHD